MCLHPLNQSSTIDAVHPDASQSFTCAQSIQPAQHKFCSTRVGYRGTSHYYPYEQSQSVSHHMPLTSHYLLVSVLPTHTWHLRSLDRLAVQTPCCSLLITSHLTSEVCSYSVMDTLPSAIITPHSEVVVHTLPLWVLTRHHPPLTPSHHYVQNAIDNTSYVQSARPATRLCHWNVISDTLPLTVSQVSRIYLVGHT